VPDAAVTAEPPEGNAVLRRDDLVGLAPYRAPGGPVQVRLARIWANLLGLDRVGLDDDFFALGGDSMTATLMFVELERVTGRKLPTAMLLKAPTVARLAIVLRRSQPDPHGARLLMPARETGSRPPLVLVHGHNGRIMFVHRLAWLMDADQPVYAVQARGFDGGPTHGSVAEMVADYADEIRKTFGDREIFLGGYCYGGILAIEVHRLLQAAGPRVRRLVLLDPPVFPRTKAREYTPAELADLARLHSEGLAKRLDQIAAGDPERTAWYSPGGQGYETAMRVAQSLAKAYSGFVPQPTRAPMTLIWSQQFAHGLEIKRQRWALAKGPTKMLRISRKEMQVTHHMLLRQALAATAQQVENVILEDLAGAVTPAAARLAPPA
jgi:thioesterase domain-containing protein